MKNPVNGTDYGNQDLKLGNSVCINAPITLLIQRICLVDG